MVLNRLKIYGELVMFSHTLFSLPFALISMLWAAGGLPDRHVVFWILIALIGARNGANALNRIVDKNIDKKNPRTANRHMPRGLVKDYETIGITLFCFSIFVYAAYKLNPLCFKLTPVALFLFMIYSYTKRFTWACHLVLGLACSGAPIGAWFAVTGKFSIIPFIMGTAVMLWVAGFDIIYGMQDIKFDRENGLFSIPAIFGPDNALMIARVFHFIMILLLASMHFIVHTGYIYLIGLGISSILLVIEHKMVSPKNKRKMEFVAYNLNQIISMVILVFAVVDIYTR